MNTFYSHPLIKGLSILLLVVFSTLRLSAQYRLVVDLNPSTNPELSPQKGFGQHDGNGTRTFFIGDNSELWTSDGTAAGTKIIKRFLFIRDLKVVNNTCYLVAQTETHGVELWRSDGTGGGTVLLKDIFPGRGDGTPMHLTNVNGTLYFSANNNVNGRELWKSDGTSAGTQLVKDIVPGTGGSLPSRLVELGSKLFFSANNGTSGTELWSSDGTSAGTLIVKDINPGWESSDPFDPVASNGWVFFTAYSPTSARQLWKTNGTAAGTTIVRVINSGSNAKLGKLIDVNGRVFFQADDGIHGVELWISDGTSAGTYMVKDLTPGPGSNAGYAHEHLEHFASINGKLFFMAAAETEASDLWMSDGTAAGTKQLTFFNPNVNTIRSEFPSFYEINGAAYFAGIQHDFEGVHLCKIDMNGNVSIVRASVEPNIFGTFFFERIGSAHYFMAGQHYWRTDGTSAGTWKVRTLGFPAGSYPHLLRDFNNGSALFFHASSALYLTGGTASTTYKILGNSISSTSQSHLGLYFFTHRQSEGQSYYPWRSNGTTSGTVPLSANVWNPRYFFPSGNFMYFPGFSNEGEELWKTDGTATGTQMVIDLVSGPSESAPRQLMDVGGNLFFTARTPPYGRELWITNGTAAGTHLVKDIWPGDQSSGIQYVTPFKGKLFFQANNGVHGRELWQSDGTNTSMIVDIQQGEYDDADMGAMAATKDFLFFAARNPDGRRSVWRSNGSSTGTVQLGDFEPSQELPRILAATSSHVIFIIDKTRYTPRYDTNFELWRADGNGLTRLIYFSDQYIADPIQMAVKGNTVYFITKAFQSESKFLWRTDGTVAGTYEIPFQGRPDELETSGQYVYLSGTAQKEGAELFIIEESVSAASEEVRDVVVELSTSDEVVTSYPNPFDRSMQLTVRGDENETFTLNVIGAKGANVLIESSLSCNTAHTVGTTWEPGLYVLRIAKRDKMLTRKVIKVKG
jgi:ELWxxDGT repeat protein